MIKEREIMSVIAQLLTWELVKWLNICLHEWAAPHLSILAKGHSPRLHVQHTGDVVSLCVAGQREGLFSIMVEVATVCAVEPHVCCCAVVKIMNGPAWNTHARSLVSTILLHDIELEKNYVHLYSNSLTECPYYAISLHGCVCVYIDFRSKVWGC